MLIANDMSIERIEVNLGPDVGKKTFKDFVQAAEWLNKEREFWRLFENECHQSHESQAIWQRFERCFQAIREVLNQFSAAQKEASECERRSAEPNISPAQRDQLLQRAILDCNPFRISLQNAFNQHYQVERLIPSSS